MKTYEAMFLVDADNPDFEKASSPIRDVLGHIQAEVLSMKPWDERRLAYEVKGRRRALYVLTFFRGQPDQLATLQQEVQLNDRILRAMVFSADHLKPEQIDAETPATLAAARRAAVEKQRAERHAAEKAAQAKAAAPAEPAQTPAGSAPEPPAKAPAEKKNPDPKPPHRDDASGQKTPEATDPGQSPQTP
jgi:small subunit ribosomal protein S6